MHLHINCKKKRKMRKIESNRLNWNCSIEFSTSQLKNFHLSQTSRQAHFSNPANKDAHSLPLLPCSYFNAVAVCTKLKAVSKLTVIDLYSTNWKEFSLRIRFTISKPTRESMRTCWRFIACQMSWIRSSTSFVCYDVDILWTEKTWQGSKCNIWQS
jgi:hypothetical protein